MANFLHMLKVGAFKLIEKVYEKEYQFHTIKSKPTTSYVENQMLLKHQTYFNSKPN